MPPAPPVTLPIVSALPLFDVASPEPQPEPEPEPVKHTEASMLDRIRARYTVTSQGTGNRYVFAFSPTLTFTSIDSSKTYGTDLSVAPGSLFAVTGYQPAVAGAFLGDDATSAYSGPPLLTSAGFDAHASVAGGPYAAAPSAR